MSSVIRIVQDGVVRIFQVDNDTHIYYYHPVNNDLYRKILPDTDASSIDEDSFYRSVIIEQKGKLIYNPDEGEVNGGNGNDVIIDKGSDPITISGKKGDDWLVAGDGDDTLHGNKGDDRLYGGKGDDKLYGGDGNDYLWSHAGDDELYGGKGDDILCGDSGNDVLRGGHGDDNLNAWTGDDVLYGGRGDDYIWGSFGDDTMTGGAGRDKFMFRTTVNPFLGNEGDDIITDFEVGKDKLEFHYFTLLGSKVGTTTFEDLTIKNNADGHAVITGYGDISEVIGGQFIELRSSVTLEGVDASELTASDFIFVG
ncbi:calcium-binding protein [Nitratireductor sp. XY-223]|uniref:calcium-binding protein n=1 Tax=Nitratireductor sp. XY-223 TaxID=2561926 RepID=UPI0010A9F92B|nr:calcium-binding protein [Nitratireductor sp. XY-223]